MTISDLPVEALAKKLEDARERVATLADHVERRGYFPGVSQQDTYAADLRLILSALAEKEGKSGSYGADLPCVSRTHPEALGEVEDAARAYDASLARSNGHHAKLYTKESWEAHVEAIRAALAALSSTPPAETGWQDIESVPEGTGTVLLGWVVDDDFEHGHVCAGFKWRGGEGRSGFYDTEGRPQPHKPTHWRPLPPPPSGRSPIATITDASKATRSAEGAQRRDEPLPTPSQSGGLTELRARRTFEALAQLSGAVIGLTQRTLDGRIYYEESPLADDNVLAAWRALDAAQKAARQALSSTPPAPNGEVET